MEGLRTYTLTITTAVLVVFLSHSTFVVSDAGKQRCSYNALISSFNRRAHEDGHRMYYECDADTGFYVEKMCGNGETFDARTLNCVEEADDMDEPIAAGYTKNCGPMIAGGYRPDCGSKVCRGRLDGIRIPNYKKGCQSFFKCFRGKAYEIFCPSGLLYNAHTDECDWPANVDCDKSTAPEPTPEPTVAPPPSGEEEDGGDGPTVTTPKWDDVCYEGEPEPECDDDDSDGDDDDDDDVPPRPTPTRPEPTRPEPTPPTPEWPPKPSRPQPTRPEPTPPTPEWPPKPTRPEPTPPEPTPPTPEWPPKPSRPQPTRPPTPPTPEWPADCPETTPCPCTCPPDHSPMPSRWQTPTPPPPHWSPGSGDCPPGGCQEGTPEERRQRLAEIAANN